MSGPGVGHEYAPVPVTWVQRDVLLFANSIGCTVEELHFLYVGACPVSGAKVTAVVVRDHR